MTKKTIKYILAGLLILTAATYAEVDKHKKTNPVMDGFAIEGMDGKLVAGKNGKWFFEFDSQLDGRTGLIEVGRKVEILPSSALEKIVADSENSKAAGYRLWGRVTTYKDENFIFPIYFLTFTEFNSKTKDSQQTEPNINEPDDAVLIPDEIIGRLKTRKIINPAQLKDGLKLKRDSILVDRTGFIEQQKDGTFTFVFDALGRNIDRFSIQLLPCLTLEKSICRQNEELEQARFKVAGIVTQYKGTNYLLLQRASFVYSYGNFSR